MIVSKNHGVKLAAIGVLALSALTGMVAPVTAHAAQVGGVATITIDNAAVLNSLAAVSSQWYFATHYDETQNALPINYSTVGGTALSSSGTHALEFDVNGSTPGNFTVTTAPCTIASCNPVPGIHYGRTYQGTSMSTAEALTTNGGGKKIGLNGAIRLLDTANTPTYLATPDLSLRKYGSQWNILSYDSGFTYANVFKLGNVSESLDGLGNLVLTGDLFWSDAFAGGNLSWSQLFVGVNSSVDLGSFSLSTPAPVPVPAAAWLFGGALSALLGLVRRKSVLPA